MSFWGQALNPENSGHFYAESVKICLPLPTVTTASSQVDISEG
jgi:hypothetical protein